MADPQNHLIVGLGGSGGKIIRHLRKTIERNHAQSSGRPSARFEYLYVDTSTDELDRHDEWKVLGKDVALDRSQYIVNQAGSVRPVLDDPTSFPGLRDWIEPKSIFDFVTPSTAGAAQRRKLGRVVFAQNAGHFVKAIEDRVRELGRDQQGGGVVVHIVCGLAGGTGSGSVVDAIAQIRNKYEKSEECRILVYALLPERDFKHVHTAAGFAPYYANAYAALSELNAMAVGQYHPVNVLDGSRMKHDVYFNGCYLIGNVNENGIQFDGDNEIPRIVAEFIYQKILNKQWDGLGRAEKGENDIKNFEMEGSIKARAKLFLSLGIERIVVPEQEIKEYLAYGFAEQATRQLMYNNYRQGEGYADEPVQKDWGSEVRKPEVVQRLLLSDAHLMLEKGILDDDANNAMWKPAQEYWESVVSSQSPQIKSDQTIEQADWTNRLIERLTKVFDETYRTMGGVRKFYEIKGKARPEMARHISRQVDKELFSQWKTGTHSLIQLRQLVDALTSVLDERHKVFEAELTKGPAIEQAILQEIAEITAQFNKVGFFGKHLTDKRSSLFDEIGKKYRELFVLRTRLEGERFAGSLIPFVKEELGSLRGTIDRLQQNLAAATEKVHQEQAARLGNADSVYQQRIFDLDAIKKVMKTMLVDEPGQIVRTQQVRQALIDKVGTGVDSFEPLSRGLSLADIIVTLSRKSDEIVQGVHNEMAKEQRVLDVNIVERLQAQYGANESGLKDFVLGLYRKSGTMLQYNKSEVDRGLESDKMGGRTGRVTTVCVFLPECESRKEFREQLASAFAQQKDPASDTVVQTGRLENEIVIMKIASLMPARYVESLAMLKKHYDGLLGDHNESYLLHGEGNGKRLPPLYALTGAQVQAQQKRRPYRLVARLLEMVKSRQNRTSGETEWVLMYEADGLPTSKVLEGRDWPTVFEGEQPEEAQQLIEREVSRRIEADYRHRDDKNALLDKFNAFARTIYEEAGSDDDPAYRSLVEMKPLVRDIIGLKD
ncbi:tubulin-like doman-containing protein [Paraburkholderia caballeronis]|uniref:Tubulin like n=1 Tax=Paraburkholderia caballeronis TaxID=416943 RepID=A0A1H7H5H2_9BURK|nr:tubulin-like doman-containing protein [Paraburkholderia caballeronis]PXW29636.1 tubulin-like protein [Paraburkholderia caballeronis]PXX04895.1 tubulin-like protein [Paraburkholderia caballeronis]RAK05956.1 tubulin-like protein [Paraburkholderia caballeronis]TDV37350.1 tubulin-like protein [Paraburkholderia caballeronis]SEB44773.1 Tubulin like [Paraburkholderia caballeronis]